MPPDLVLLSTLNGSNYPCLELNFMVPKVFEPLKFDCILNEPLYCIAPEKKGLRNKTNIYELSPKTFFSRSSSIVLCPKIKSVCM